ALEESLNTTLFHRHARGLILTEQGELLFDATSAMARRLDTAEARIRDSEEEVFGELRVTTTTGFGSLWLAPRLPALYDKYPDLKIDLMLEERVLDLPMREADVAIRMKEPSQADLIRRKLMSVHMRLYATPDYLDQMGVPERLEDLSDHRLICQNVQATQVSAGAELVRELLTYDVRSTLTVNNYFGVLQAVRSGLGVGVLPDYVIQDFDNIVRVLPDVESKEVPVFLAYPEELRQSRRIAAFRDFVTEEIIAHRKKTRKEAGTAA
ncbi:MAG: LysR family transcriptional regulator, partial [Silicimonas sp.]|nr:LysR family transcriptional regulator [Silicimonas sp.]